MKRLTALLPILSCACATIPAPDPILPPRIDATSAEQLYRAYELVCSDGQCKQGEDSYEVRAFERTRLDGPRRVLSANRHARNGVSWAFFGLSIGSALGSGLSFIYSADYHDESADAWRGRGIAFAGGAAASLLIGLLVRAAWPAPTESFEAAYNKALEVELAKRVVAAPVATSAAPELSKAEKECIRDRAASPNRFSKLGIGRCIQKR